MKDYIDDNFRQTKRPPADAPPRVEIDVARYQHLLDTPHLSDAQKEEILKALWLLMSSFIDLGFGVHPLRQSPVLGENVLAPPRAPPVHSETIQEPKPKPQEKGGRL